MYAILFPPTLLAFFIVPHNTIQTLFIKFIFLNFESKEFTFKQESLLLYLYELKISYKLNV